MRRIAGRIGGWVAAGVLVAACGGSAPAPADAPTAAPTVAIAAATPAPSPTPVPTVAPTVAPSPTSVPTVAPTPTAVPTTTSMPTVAATPVAGAKPSAATELVPSEPVQAARQAVGQVSSYRITGVIMPKDGGKMDMQIEYVAPDRMRVTMRGDDADQNMEMVAIGNATYVNVGGTWMKQEGGLTGMDGGTLLQTLDLTDLVQEMEGGTLTRQGTEVVDGEPCVVYDYRRPDGSGKIWVGARDNLVRKIEGMDDNSTFTMLVTDINKPIDIKAPI